MREVIQRTLRCGWDFLGAAARWWLCWTTAIVVFFAVVPGGVHHDWEYLGQGGNTNAYYDHGWPATYLYRRGEWTQPPTDTCWALRTGVLEFSWRALVVDIAVAVAILMIVAQVNARFDRLRRFQFSLRGLLLGVLATSLLMAWPAKYRRTNLEMAQTAQSLSTLYAGDFVPPERPTWLCELLPSPPPDWLQEWEVWGPPPSNRADAELLNRALQLRPNAVELHVDLDESSEQWRPFINRVKACRSLGIDFRAAPSTNLMANAALLVAAMPRLETLSINPWISDELWPAERILASAPLKELKTLQFRDACLTYQDLMTIGRCDRLETLELRGHHYGEPLVTSAGLRELRNLSRLRNLVLVGSLFEIDHDTSFQSLQDLRFLTLYHVVNHGWSPSDLVPMSRLIGVNLSGMQITLADVQTIVKLPCLKYLVVRDCGLDAAALRQLQLAYPHVQLSF